MAGKCSTSPQQWMKGNTIGSGSFGIVNLAMNKSTAELFVAKSSESVAGIRSLENEADILEKLNSPYIVRYLGKDFSNGANLFMEFMGGGNLSDLMEKFGGSLHESVIRLYTREILEGLKYLQKNGIVHCDIKCKNMLLGSSGNIKLGDFGCARRLNLSNRNDDSMKFSWKSISGTPLWMAPEVLRNERLDFESDIWSLGCTIIEMATGRNPWGDEAANPMATIFKIACSNYTPQFPTKFSKDGLDFLAKCMQRDPNMRWSSEELLKHPFVSMNSTCGCLNEDARSPASILDIGLYESNYESDGSEVQIMEELPTRIPLATCCSSQRDGFTRLWGRDSTFVSSENWINVKRSHSETNKRDNNYCYNMRAKRKQPAKSQLIWVPLHRVVARQDRAAVISRNMSSRFAQKLPIASVVVTDWVIRIKSSVKSTRLFEYECYKLEG